MKTKNVDTLNIVLILVSLYLAFRVPFELFLFSYAVLGPLHYISEINWLNQKNFFVKEKKSVLVLVVFAILVTFLMIIKLPSFNGFRASILPDNYLLLLDQFAKVSILTTLFFSITIVFFKKIIDLIFWLIISILVSYFILKHFPFIDVLVVVFIPTLIHVYLFTFLFMIFGYLKSKNKMGLIALFLMISVPVIIVISKIKPIEYNDLSNYSKESFLVSGMPFVIKNICDLIKISEDQQISLISIPSIKIQIFIAFAYTYHYLNWFSKTSIIGWYGSITKKRKIIFLIFWILSISLYLYNYKVGILVLFFLSILHVYVEFPLNVITVKGIFNNINITKLYK